MASNAAGGDSTAGSGKKNKTVTVVKNKYAEFMRQGREQWDPTTSVENQPSNFLPPSCIHRIKRDIKFVIEDVPPGINIYPEPDDISKIHALIIGPFDTPYEGGFFHFYIQCPPNYPIHPPKARLMTTGSNQVRFNPNLYKSGKICLSILGTWEGPSWTPAMNILSLLLSIQSLLNDKPYHNEPGFSAERVKGDSERYNKIIQHETIRVSVCNTLEDKQRQKSTYSLPDMLLAFAMNSFQGFYSQYRKICQANVHLDGQDMNDPFGEERGKFNFSNLLKRLEKIKLQIDSTMELDSSDSDSDSL